MVMTGYDLDSVGYAILRCLYDNEALWKKKIGMWVNDHVDELPIDGQKSVQTIGRRIDRLHDAGLLETCILQSEEVKREMIIGYKLTEDGQHALAVKRTNLLRDMVITASADLLTSDDYDHDPVSSVDREPLIALLVDAFDIDDEIRNTVLPQIGTNELLHLLAIRCFLANAGSTFSPENEDAIMQFLQKTPQFRQPFQQRTIVTQMRDTIAATVNTGWTAPSEHTD